MSGPATSPGSFLPGEGWRTGADGMPRRDAARVVVLDADGRVLLVRGHDADRPERTWWFTVGGGIDPGEDAEQAAVREVAEETGLVLDPARLVGPVATRSAIFDFQARSVRQHETFFAYRLAERGAAELSRDGWTDVERAFMDEAAWWTLPALRAITVEVFPSQLADLVALVADGLADLEGREALGPASTWPRPVLDLGHEEEGVSIAAASRR